MDRIKNAYADLPIFSMFNRGEKTESSDMIKIEQILGHFTSIFPE